MDGDFGALGGCLALGLVGGLEGPGIGEVEGLALLGEAVAVVSSIFLLGDMAAVVARVPILVPDLEDFLEVVAAASDK